MSKAVSAFPICELPSLPVPALGQDVAFADAVAAARVGAELAVEDEVDFGIRARYWCCLGNAGKRHDNGGHGREKIGWLHLGGGGGYVKTGGRVRSSA